MKLTFSKMSELDACDILAWRYEGPCENYNPDAWESERDVSVFSDPENSHVRVLNLDPNYFPAKRYLGFNYEIKGDYAARIAQAVKLSEIAGAPERGEAIRESFEKGGWRGFLRDATTDNKFDLHPYLVATFAAERGDNDQAIALLEKLYRERSSDLVLIKVDPRLDGLRGDARFQDLLRRVGFSE